LKKFLGRIIVISLSVFLSLWFLWPTYKAQKMEKEYETLQANSTRSPEDSLKYAQWFQKNNDDFVKQKRKRLKLGLDLRGGIYVTMEVDVVRLLEATAQMKDAILAKVIDSTRVVAALSDEPVITIFSRIFQGVAVPQGKSLTQYYYFGNIREANDEKILAELKSNLDNAVERAKEIVRNRVDQYGLTEPTIQTVGSRRIILELPGVSNESEVRRLLEGTALLEFKMVKDDQVTLQVLQSIDRYLAGTTVRDTAKTDSAKAAAPVVDSAALATDSTRVADSSATAVADTAKADSANPYAGLSEDESRRRYQADHPLTSSIAILYEEAERGQMQQYAILNQTTFPKGMYFFRVDELSRKKVQAILARPDVRHLVPEDVQFAFSAKPLQMYAERGGVVFEMWAINSQPELTGDVVTDARATIDPNSSQPEVLMEMNADGSRDWARITGANIKKRCAIVLDSAVYSAPTIQSKIPGGQSQITGSSNMDEAKLLAIVLKAGALPAPVQIIEERTIGPSLGEDSIRDGIYSSLAAFLGVVVFMIFYYVMGGVVADVAVLLNCLIILSVLAGFGATLTLPGIAGVILTIGMAVDANVLIFERIREELATGKTLRVALDLGYQRSLRTIIDSHVTTLITGVVLLQFGSGPIQGFAVTLIVGLLASLFTAVVVTRTMFDYMLERGTHTINFG
jgi:SecD/SecF fusion protein